MGGTVGHFAAVVRSVGCGDGRSAVRSAAVPCIFRSGRRRMKDKNKIISCKLQRHVEITQIRCCYLSCASFQTGKYTVQRQIVQRFFHRRIRQTEPLLQNAPRYPPVISSEKTCLRVRFASLVSKIKCFGIYLCNRGILSSIQAKLYAVLPYHKLLSFTLYYRPLHSHSIAFECIHELI